MTNRDQNRCMHGLNRSFCAVCQGNVKKANQNSSSRGVGFIGAVNWPSMVMKAKGGQGK